MDALHAHIVLLRQWTEPHRFYHSLSNHLLPMLQQIDVSFDNPFDRNLLAQMAWWHDAICLPGKKDNEEQSVLLMREHTTPHPRVEHGIMATVHHMPTGDAVVDYFLKLDLAPLATNNTNVLHRNEGLLRAEYGQFGEQEYCEGRVEFLTKMLDHPLIPDNAGVKWLIEHIQARLDRVIAADIEARR